MDAVAVAMASGCAVRKIEWMMALRMAFFFGFFQMLMPLIGWLAGLGFKRDIASFDHWLAFVLLLIIGVKMIREARSPRRLPCPQQPARPCRCCWAWPWPPASTPWP